MSSICPNCGRRLHWYNVKAECPECGVNIPNYNWEARLQADSEIAERKFASYYCRLNRLAYSVYGTKLRIARLVVSLLSVVAFVFPWAVIKGNDGVLGLDLFGLCSDVSLLDVVKDFFAHMSSYSAIIGDEGLSGAFSLVMLSILLMALSFLLCLIALLMIFFTVEKSRTLFMTAFDVLGIICAVASVSVFNRAVLQAGNTVLTVAEHSFSDMSSSVLWGFYVVFALMALAAVLNVSVALAPAKSNDELEAERLERKSKKEAQEHEKEVAAELARLKAEREAQQEQAEKVSQAKEALLANKKENNKK